MTQGTEIDNTKKDQPEPKKFIKDLLSLFHFV